MKKLLPLLIISICKFSFADVYISVCDGPWTSPVIWQDSLVPNPSAGDSIYIQSNVTYNGTINLVSNYLHIAFGSELCGGSLALNNTSSLTIDGTTKFSGTVTSSGTILVNSSGLMYSNGVFLNGGSMLVLGNTYVGWSGSCAPITSSCLSPVANFNLSDSVVCVNDCILFTDLTQNLPSSWNWQISGPSSFNSTVQNPTFCFNQAGLYSVKLIVSNTMGIDSILKNQLITVHDTSSSTMSVHSCNSFLSPSGIHSWNLSGTYTDTLPNSNGCDSIITINLTIQNSDTSYNDTSCTSYVSPSGAIWTNSGQYVDTLFAANQNGCDSILYINLTVYSNDLASFTFSDTVYCLTDLPISPQVTGTTGGTFSIDNNATINATNGTITSVGNMAGNYLVNYITNGFCPDSSSKSIRFVKCPPVVQIEASSQVICKNECIDFSDQSLSSDSNGIFSWLWTFNGADSLSSTQQNPTNICYHQPGIYPVTLAIIDSNGTSTTTLNDFITVRSCEEIQIPNVFSPNGDGKNDLFLITGGELSNLDLKIYNRWGQLLHETSQLMEGWNGRTTAGAEVPEGTYFYLVHVEQFGAKKELKGSITLFR